MGGGTERRQGSLVDLATATASLRSGGVLVVPTDTVYGLACDPRSREAVDRVFAIKARPAEMELSLLGATQAELEGLVEMAGEARALAAAFWPGPLSLVCPARPAGLAIPRRATSLMVRVPAHDLLRRLLAGTGPLASTSANSHRAPPATAAAAALAEWAGEVDGVLDGGPAAGVASTIIDLTSRPPRVLREGPIGADEIRPFLGG